LIIVFHVLRQDNADGSFSSLEKVYAFPKSKLFQVILDCAFLNICIFIVKDLRLSFKFSGAKYTLPVISEGHSLSLAILILSVSVQLLSLRDNFVTVLLDQVDSGAVEGIVSVSST
jgi:hypothetical protein